MENYSNALGKNRIVIEDIKVKIIIDLVKDRLKAFSIYIFGSAVNIGLREDSDIDIAFLSDTVFCPYEIFTVAQELSGLIGKDIDIVDIKDSSEVFKVQVIGGGVEVFCSDPLRSAYFRMHALKDYAVLNERRAVVLDSIKERGSIYAG